MGVYLEDNPPARSQFRTARRATATGAIVIHTAENTTDVQLPDHGAEAVAQFISTRTDTSGSYHSIVDSDSIVRVGRYEWEMFHEGTGGNRWSLGLAFACEAWQWPVLPQAWRDAALRNGAVEAVRMARWVRSTAGAVVPATKITAKQYRDGQPGFVGHGSLDPGRRTDPGAGFPWDEFLRRFKELTMAEHQQTVTASPQVCTLSAAMDELRWLYRVYTGQPGDKEHLEEWGRDMADKIYNEEPIWPTLHYVQYELDRQRRESQPS